MAVTLNDLQDDVLGRIEENLPTAAYAPGPTFWNLAGELYPSMVDAMYEATLLTGVVQMVNIRVDLAAGTNWFFLMPKGAIASLRMRAPYPIRKTSLFDLDAMNPGWQRVTPQDQIRSWFPLGTSGFGIYPALAHDAQVVMDFIASPVNTPRPYAGTEPVPFQEEFTDMISQYGAALLRNKEGGAEAEEGQDVYKQYLSRARALSLFQGRLDQDVLTGDYGGKTQTNPRQTV